MDIISSEALHTQSGHGRVHGATWKANCSPVLTYQAKFVEILKVNLFTQPS